MTMKNRYAKRSKISEPKFRQLVRLFALNLEATQIAELTALNRNTVNRFLRAIRERLATFCEQQSPLVGEIEVDESFFGPRRVKGKRGRGAYGKTIVFGVFKRNVNIPKPVPSRNRGFRVIAPHPKPGHAKLEISGVPICCSLNCSGVRLPSDECGRNPL